MLLITVKVIIKKNLRILVGLHFILVLLCITNTTNTTYYYVHRLLTIMRFACY